MVQKYVSVGSGVDEGVKRNKGGGGHCPALCNSPLAEEKEEDRR